MMRIAYIVHSLNLGGTERLAADMSIALKNNFDIRIICLDEPGIWAPHVRENGVPVVSLYRQPGLDLRMPVKLAQFAKMHKIDLFHAHQCTPWFYAALSRMLYSKPRLLFEEHGRLYPEILSRKRRWFNRLVLQHLTHKVVAVSQDVKNRLFTYEGVSLKKTTVIYNGTKASPPISPTDRIDLRRRFGFTDTDIVAGCVGRLDPIKNIPLFINGFKKAKDQCPDLKAILIGDGPLFEDIRKTILSSGLQDSIVLAGYQPDAAKLAAMMDIFILVSFSEGTSMALLESMAAGVPSIVTHVGGNPEIVIDQQTGWLIPSDDQAAMAATLTDAAVNKEKRQNLGENARKRFLDNFTFNRMVHVYQKIYSEL